MQTATDLVDEIQDWIVQNLAANLEISPTKIELDKPFSHYGVDSMQAVMMVGDLESWLKIRLEPTVMWDYPTIKSLAVYVSQINQPNSSQLGESVQDIPAEYYKFELNPEYLYLRSRLAELGAANPYFKVHEGLTNDTACIEGRQVINYSNYNYLGMSGDPIVSEAAKQAIEHYGTSVSASRIASGEKPLHQELEQALADLIGVEASLVFVGGHATNVSVIGHLVGTKDLVIHDSLIHNSALMGIATSGARRMIFPHNDWKALDQILTNCRKDYQRVLVIIEGVYSTDGDIADLPNFIAVKKRHKVFLMVDEAHSVGVIGKTGRGISEYFGIKATEVDVWMGTLSKAFASCGGYIAGSQALIEYLKYTAGGFVYSVGITPPNAAAALASLRLMLAEPERVNRLQARAALFLRLARDKGFNVGQSQDSAVIPIIIGDSNKAIRLSHLLFEAGINVQPMIYPSVPNDAARLRFFLACTHTGTQIRQTITTLAELYEQI